MLSCDVPASVLAALQQRSEATGEDTSVFVSRVLRRTLVMPMHTLFQVSTSGALVQGVYQGAVSSALLLAHGDFGLGTFDKLDGEMIVLDGVVYQVCSDGTVHHVDGGTGTPFATVLRFSPDQTVPLGAVRSFLGLCAICDLYRTSHNLFYAFRVDGMFRSMHTRAMQRTQSGTPLTAAAATQPEFRSTEIEGTLVGFWSPLFAGMVDIPGYHFHFLSKDRSRGGHVLDCTGEDLCLQLETVRDFHLSLPDSQEFLRADLTADRSHDLSVAEGNQSERNS